MNLGRITAALSLNIGNFTKSVRQAQTQMTNAFGSPMTSQINKTNASLDKTKDSFKEIHRIVGGILISQMFYNAMRSIRSTRQELIGFMGDLEKSQAAAKILLGTDVRATGFISNMQDLAAKTAFDTGSAIEFGQRLIAAGFEAEKIRSIMETLNDTSSITAGFGSNKLALDRISLALAQIKTSGTLKGMEVRQLYEARVPIFEILKEELGLSDEQLGDLGNQRIKSEAAIDAILRGLKKRFEGAAESIAIGTMPGLIETIKDNTMIFSSELFKPLYDNIKEGVVRPLRELTEEVRDVLWDSGVGGVFETFIPKHMHTAIRSIVASVGSLKDSFADLGKALQPVATTMLTLFTGALAIVLPPVAGLTSVISRLAVVALETAPILRHLAAAIATVIVATLAGKSLIFLWRIMQMGKIAAAVAAAIMKLVGALRVLMIAALHPAVAAIMAVGGALMYFTGAGSKASGWINSFIKSLNGMMGINLSNVLKPVTNQTKELMEAFNEDYFAGDSISQGFRDAAKEAEKASKKINGTFLASFDEVYSVPEQSNLGGGLGDIGDMVGDLEDLSGLIANSQDFGLPGLLEDSIPSIENSLNTMAGLFDTFKQKLKEIFTWDGIKDYFGRAVSAVSDAVAPLATSLGDWLMQFQIVNDVVDKAKDFWTTWGADVVGIFTTTWELIKTVFTEVGTAIWTIVSISWDAISAFFTDWGADIMSFFTGFFTLGKALWELWSDDIKKLVQIGWANVYAIFSTTLDIILHTLGSAFRILNETVQLALNILKGDWSAAWENILTIIETALIAVNYIIESLLDLAWTIISNALDVFVTLFSMSWTLIKEITGDVWESIVDTLAGVLDDLVIRFEIWKTIVMDLLDALWTASKQSVIDHWEAIGVFISTATDNIKTLFSNWKTSITSIVSDTWAKVKSNTTSSWDALVKKIQAIVDNITRIYDNMKNGVVRTFESMWSSVKGIINSMITGINKMIDAISSLKIDIPRVEIPGTDIGIGGGSIGFPRLPKIPHLETGGIIRKESLFVGGEKNRNEAVVPLQNPGYMRPFSEAVANDLAAIMGQGQQVSSDNRPILYVGTMIADDRGIKELERKLQVYRISEQQRRGLE